MTADAPSDRAARLARLFRAQGRRIWGLAYRLTGSAEEADDVVQETFARLGARSHELVDAHVGPWLVRVATNLGVDALRRRRRCVYVGPWLPSPIDLELHDAETSAPADPEARYGRAESLGYAFLVALEVLGPRARAVLLLRDVLGYSARETAGLIDTTEGNVRVLHLRARNALAHYDRRRGEPTPEIQQRHRAAMQTWLTCLLAQDARGLEALLAESVRTITDAGGEYTALAAPLAGRARVARFYLTAARHRQDAGAHAQLRVVNGLPALLITLDRPKRRQAPRTLMRCELDDDDRMCVVQSISAPRKLAGLDRVTFDALVRVER